MTTRVLVTYISAYTTARGQDQKTVRAFYSDVLSAPAETTEERY